MPINPQGLFWELVFVYCNIGGYLTLLYFLGLILFGGADTLFFGGRLPKMKSPFWDGVLDGLIFCSWMLFAWPIVLPMLAWWRIRGKS